MTSYNKIKGVKVLKIIDKSVYNFSKDNEPIERAKPGDILLFKTLDCFGGQISSEDQLVHELDLTKANPAAGPVYIEDAEPGDVLVVDILDITVGSKGFACSIPNSGPLHEGSEVRTKVIPIEDGYAKYNDIYWPINPMVGVIGTAPETGSVACGYADNHGGNIDSKLIKKGSRVYLPIRVKGALFQLGDLHATMGDGEICGTGIEICGEVLTKISIIKNLELNWPITETISHWYVNATGKSYDESLMIASKELCRLMKPVYNWDQTDVFIYLSLQGDVGINQGTRPMYDDMVNVRIGIPKVQGKEPLIKNKSE